MHISVRAVHAHAVASDDRPSDRGVDVLTLGGAPGEHNNVALVITCAYPHHLLQKQPQDATALVLTSYPSPDEAMLLGHALIAAANQARASRCGN